MRDIVGNQEFLTYYSEKTQGDYRITLAATMDKNGFTGWKKWDGVDFTRPGIDGLAGVPLVPNVAAGANPSVVWNMELLRYIMVWHGWNGSIFMSSSFNGRIWDDPKEILTCEMEGYKNWYPNLISENGDKNFGTRANLYYAKMHEHQSSRKFVYRTIEFS